MILPVEVSDRDAVDAAASKVEETFGPMDVWVNNAMVSMYSPVNEMNSEDYQRVTDVLYLGFVHENLAALKRMLSRDKVPIIQI